MTYFLLFLTLVLLIVVFVVLLRLWPALRGRVDPQGNPSDRLYKWNTYVSPHIQKYLETEILIASCGLFKSGRSGVELSIATWSMEPTIITDVDFIAIADMDGDNGEVEVLGFIKAETLRSVLGGIPEGQAILGHRIWTYILPEHIDKPTLCDALTAPERFKAEYDLTIGKAEKDNEP